MVGSQGLLLSCWKRGMLMIHDGAVDTFILRHSPPNKLAYRPWKRLWPQSFSLWVAFCLVALCQSLGYTYIHTLITNQSATHCWGMWLPMYDWFVILVESVSSKRERFVSIIIVTAKTLLVATKTRRARTYPAGNSALSLVFISNSL